MFLIGHGREREGEVTRSLYPNYPSAEVFIKWQEPGKRTKDLSFVTVKIMQNCVP